jgi:dolichol-phosphate mannosyltransferase
MNILVINPTYITALNVPTLISDILNYGNEESLVEVIDDASPDGLTDVVFKLTRTDPRIHLVRRSGKLGLGTPYMEGFRTAQERDYARIRAD